MGGPERTIKWHTNKTPSSHSITDMFLLRSLNGLLFLPFQVLLVHERRLYIHGLLWKLLTPKSPCAQLHRRIQSRGHCEVIKTCA